jgi:hypothetical protein
MIRRSKMPAGLIAAFGLLVFGMLVFVLSQIEQRRLHKHVH